MKARPEDPSILRDILTAALARTPGGDWSVTTDDMWCRAAPAGSPLPGQGWKLHVSATMLSAPVVLSRVVPVLLGAGCAFKFPRGLDDYWNLTGPHSPRASAGKFVTAYPSNDDETVRLAALLDDVTTGLPGPVVLSDRPYRRGGIVHYRYGTFGGHRVLGNDGFYEIRLRTPEGELVRDERLPRFSPPPFAACPFEAPHQEGRRPSAVVLNGRFVVREAVRHANKGGVYVAEDRVTGDEVIVKEGRPHAAADLAGRDARDRVLTERACLDALAATGVVPSVVDLFEQGGHVFLAEELIPGTTLRHWSERHAGPLGEDGFGHAAERVLPVLRRLVEALGAVHRHGHVLRDLSPENVMLTPDGDVRFVDLEYATTPGTTVMVGGTPGFLAPELVPYSGRFMPAPDATADLFALGALTFFLATGAPPQPGGGADLAEVAAANETLALLLPLVTGLMDEPVRRWPLERCARFLDEPVPRRAPGRVSPGAAVDPVAAGLAHLVETMDRRPDRPSPRPSLWPNVTEGVEVDPCAVNAGAAGVLAVLTLARRTGEGDRDADAAGHVTRWLRERLAREDLWPPGLYFGRSGALWALYEAAEDLGDTGTAEFALAAARRLPVDHPSPDVTHGLAGCGMTLLRLALRSGDPVLLARAEEAFGNLHEARTYRGTRPSWPVPASFDSGLAGADHLGYAHGVAGVGTALLGAAQTLGRPEWMTTVHEIAHTLGEHAEVDGDTAWWPTLPHEPLTLRPRRPHWCSGSSGIGSFLVRYWRATGDPEALSLAGMAATAVHRVRWQLGPVPCHGLPGEGEFLLDMADLAGDERCLGWAGDLARCLRAAPLLAPPGFLTGTAGVLAFLLRLRHRSPRLWTLDDVVSVPGTTAFPQEAAAQATTP